MSGDRSPSRHYCDQPECGKSFRRAEHLTRHKLNQEPDTNFTIQCPQCDRLFYRRDLLQRHLTLKHGKASGAGRRTNTGIVPLPEHVSSPATHGSALAHPAGNFQRTEESSQLPLATHIPEALANGGAVDDVALPIPGELFPFPSPTFDLARDWGWLHQSLLPVVPVRSDPVGQADSNSEMPDFQCPNDDWMNPSSPQDLYISQQVHDFLVTLSPIIEANHSFTTEDTSSILNAAFQFVMESLPIIHQPTFSFDLIPGELCASIFCVGLLITHDPAIYHIGCALLGRIRSDLLQYVDKNTVYLTDLAILQAMLLVEFSGMYLADRAAMELSDIFHGTLVTLSRRLGLFEMAQRNGSAASVSTDDSEWQNPIEHESAKRLAYFVFALDVEQALFFGHERSILSIYSIKLDLPSDERDWQAPTSHGTHTKSQNIVQRTKFHHLCHNLLSKAQGHMTIPSNLTQISNFVILLGLTSVVLDLLRRQQDPFFDTKHALSRLGSVLPAIHSRIMAGPEGSTKIHGRTVYHITVIALCTPLEDLERAANDGFSRTGRTPKQHTRSAIIRLLTRHKVGADPARHAIHLLKLYLLPVSDSEITSNQSAGCYPASPNAAPPAGYSPYEPSALYFGVLTLWAYIIGRVRDDDDSQLVEGSYIPDNDLLPSQPTGSSSSAPIPIAALLKDMEAAIDNDDTPSCRRYWWTIVHYVTGILALRSNNNAQEYSQVLRSLSDTLVI